jgi:hypothetical protein
MKTKRSKKRWAWTTENRRKHTPVRYYDCKAMTAYNNYARKFSSANKQKTKNNCKLIIIGFDPDFIDWTPKHSNGQAFMYFF